MDLEVAELIAIQLESIGFKGAVNLSGTGEATLTKYLPDLIKKFGDRNIHIEIVTNGDKLKPKLIKDLYSSGLKQLVISMYDGPEQIEYFNSLFGECGIEENLYTLRDRWYDEEEDYGLIYTNRTGSIGKKLLSPEKRHCYYPHYSMYIDWNGDVLLCCQDMYNRTVKFGNVKDKPLFDIWIDKHLMDYRNKLKNGDRTTSPCSSCNANGMIFGENHAKLW
jgi:radical SAM protein with 4Fe4S-binding SPASM domain